MGLQIEDPVEESITTDQQLRALKILQDHGPCGARPFGKLLWPDNEKWDEKPGRGPSEKPGAGMASSAGGYLGKLKALGWVGKPPGSKTGWALTQEGFKTLLKELILRRSKGQWQRLWYKCNSCGREMLGDEESEGTIIHPEPPSADLGTEPPEGHPDCECGDAKFFLMKEQEPWMDEGEAWTHPFGVMDTDQPTNTTHAI